MGASATFYETINGNRLYLTPYTLNLIPAFIMEKKFRILHTEWSEGLGGQEMRILLEIQEHRRMGHQVYLLAPPESPLLKAAREKGITVIPFKIRHTFDLPALRHIRRILREEKIDVLHTHSSVDSWVASAAGKWAGTPVLIRTRHISVPARKRPLNKIYALPDAVITTGEQIRQTLITVYGLAPSRVHSLPTGVDTGRFFPRPPDRALKQALGLPPESLVITLVAVLRAQKRHELVIAAAPDILRRYPQARFLFVGEGPRRAVIEEEIHRRGLEPFFIMTGHRTDIPEILALTDVGIISSSAEGVPQFLLQALAMARPMVATSVGGIPNLLIDGRNGLLIPPEDPAALTAAVFKIFDDPSFSSRLGQEGLTMIRERFTAAQMAEQICQIYRSVYEGKGKVRTHG
jgi:glycosyltransferase involved in cell wall biosynthesis